MSEPEVLSVNVSDSVKSSESMGGKDDMLKKIFPNPKADPRIAGSCGVKDMETLEKVAPMAFEYSKQQGKPVLIVVSAVQGG